MSQHTPVVNSGASTIPHFLDMASGSQSMHRNGVAKHQLYVYFPMFYKNLSI